MYFNRVSSTFSKRVKLGSKLSSYFGIPCRTVNSEKRPVLSAAMVRHAGAVNRVRAWNAGDRVLCANWSERAEVHIWDLAEQLKATHDKHAMSNFIRYTFKKSSHQFP